MKDNLFLRLHGWALGQDENFMTESFAYLLRHLLQYDAAVGVRLLARLTDRFMQVKEGTARDVSVSTQVTVEGKRPDIEISAPGWLVYVEVKVEAPLGSGQVANYIDRLSKDRTEQKALVLLTRYEPWVDISLDWLVKIVKIRWYQLGNWLEEALTSGALGNASSRFLIEQFYEFLRGRRMTIGHVDRELQRGVQALVSLMTMLRHALVEHGLVVRDNVRWYEWFGFEVGPSGLVTYYIGVYANAPTLLKLRTWAVQVDPVKVEALGKGRLWQQSGRFRWEYTIDLAEEGAGFYEMTTEDQITFLKDHIAKCSNMIDTIAVTVPVSELTEDEGEASES